MRLKNLLITSIVLTSLFMFAALPLAATKAVLIYQETDLGGGQWKYNYTFYNTSDAGESLYKVTLFFNGPVTVTGDPLPSGWVGTVWEGTYTTTFMNTTSQYSSGYIPAGGSLGGFSFTVDNQVSNIGWYAEFRDSEGGLSTLTGTTTPSQ